MDVIKQVNTLTTDQGYRIFYRTWIPEASPKALIHIHHGMAEHSLRYHALAHALCEAGYAVIAHDHRGHGNSVSDTKDLGHIGDHSGWQYLLQDSISLRQHMASLYPDVPQVLFGHSMDSFITLNLAQQPHQPKPAGLILSGSALTPKIKRLALNQLSKLERARLGKRGKSPLISKMTFEDFNRKCKPIRTQADWLSRDPNQVDQYLKDELCGFECTTETWFELSKALLTLLSPEALKRVPSDLPTLLLYGEQDPMGGLDSNLKLIKQLKTSGVRNLEHRGYPGARHEVLHEFEADHVIADCIEWLDRCVG